MAFPKYSSFYIPPGVVVMAVVCLAISSTGTMALSPSFYATQCPSALPTIRRVVLDAINQERRMGASLLRLHFHDCFVNGCDASILLDQTPTIDSEKNALPNANSARGFEVIDRIKAAVDSVCGPSVVSCADILAVAARDSVVALGGPGWPVQLGRRDSTSASRTDANNNIPSPFMDLSALISNFQAHGLNVNDLVALSGAHTLGFAQCLVFKNRIYNDTNIDSTFARIIKRSCPSSGGDSNLSPLDSSSPGFFDLKYFKNLLGNAGLLHSDQALFGTGAQTNNQVNTYSSNFFAFKNDFAASMIKLGNIKLLTGTQGQIRLDCKKVN